MEFLNKLFNISITGESVADLIFFFVSAFSLILTFILFFHWRRYGIGRIGISIAEIIYLVGSAGLIMFVFLQLP